MSLDQVNLFICYFSHVSYRQNEHYVFYSKSLRRNIFFLCFRFVFREKTQNLLKKTNITRARNHKIYFIDASIKMIEEGSSIKTFLLALIVIIMCVNVETYVFARIFIKLNKNWRMS